MLSHDDAWRGKLSALRKQGKFTLAARIKPSALPDILSRLAHELPSDASPEQIAALLGKIEVQAPDHFYNFAQVSELEAEEARAAATAPQLSNVTKAEIATWSALQRLEFVNSGKKPPIALIPKRKPDGPQKGTN